MSPKRGDRVAPPPAAGEWELRFATTEAVKGWEQLCRHAATNTLAAWTALRTRGDNPTQQPDTTASKAPRPAPPTAAPT